MGLSANSTAVIGFSPEKSTANPEFAPGTDVLANGTSYTYAKAAAQIAIAGDTALTGAFGATTTTTGTTHSHDVPVAVPINEYFWARLKASTL